MKISKLTPEVKKFRNQLRYEIGRKEVEVEEDYSEPQPRQLTPKELHGYRNDFRAALGKPALSFTENLPLEPKQLTNQELQIYRNDFRAALGKTSFSNTEDLNTRNSVSNNQQTEVQKFRNQLRARI